MYRKILEYSLNLLPLSLVIFVIYSLNHGWNWLWFFMIVGLILIVFLLVAVSSRRKPKIDSITSKTYERGRIIVQEISSSFDEILERNKFKLYHREINSYGVDIRYKREKDKVVFHFNYHPLDYPYGAELLISHKSLFRLFFTTVLNLKNPKQTRSEKLFYSLINKETDVVDIEQIKDTVDSMKEDFTKYASDFLKNDYENIKKEHRLNKKFYRKCYGWLFYI